MSEYPLGIVEKAEREGMFLAGRNIFWFWEVNASESLDVNESLS